MGLVLQISVRDFERPEIGKLFDQDYVKKCRGFSYTVERKTDLLDYSLAKQPFMQVETPAISYFFLSSQANRQISYEVRSSSLLHKLYRMFLSVARESNERTVVQ